MALVAQAFEVAGVFGGALAQVRGEGAVAACLEPPELLGGVAEVGVADARGGQQGGTQADELVAQRGAHLVQLVREPDQFEHGGVAAEGEPAPLRRLVQGAVGGGGDMGLPRPVQAVQFLGGCREDAEPVDVGARVGESVRGGADDAGEQDVGDVGAVGVMGGGHGRVPPSAGSPRAGIPVLVGPIVVSGGGRGHRIIRGAPRAAPRPRTGPATPV